MDPYQVLGVSKTASADEIKRAYKRLAKETHPDSETGDEEKFKQISLAYETLSDPQKRARVDNPNPNPFGGFGPFAQFWQTAGVFNFEVKPRPPRYGEHRGDDIQYGMAVSPFQILLNRSISIEYDRKVRCSVCEGHGSDFEECVSCQGTGIVSETIEAGHQKHRKQYSCEHCLGRGYSQKNKCQACGGNGLATVKDSITFELGRTGSKGIVFGGSGHYGPFQGPPGDLIVQVRVVYPDQSFISDEARELLERAEEAIHNRGATNDK